MGVLGVKGLRVKEVVVHRYIVLRAEAMQASINEVVDAYRFVGDVQAATPGEAVVVSGGVRAEDRWSASSGSLSFLVLEVQPLPNNGRSAWFHVEVDARSGDHKWASAESVRGLKS